MNIWTRIMGSARGVSYMGGLYTSPNPGSTVSAMADTTLNCRDCGQDWIWDAGEQAFYAEKQQTRCWQCGLPSGVPMTVPLGVLLPSTSACGILQALAHVDLSLVASCPLACHKLCSWVTPTVPMATDSLSAWRAPGSCRAGDLG
eukprot:gene5472-979_t